MKGCTIGLPFLARQDRVHVYRATIDTLAYYLRRVIKKTSNLSSLQKKRKKKLKVGVVKNDDDGGGKYLRGILQEQWEGRQER